MGTGSLLRVRALLDDHVVVVVGVLVLLAVVGGALVYVTYVDPGEETHEVTVQAWTSTASFDHSATVTEPTRAFPEGTELEDRPTYFTEIAPVLEGTFSYQFAATGGHLDVDVDLVLVYRAVDDGVEHWRVEEPLGQTAATIEPGEAVTIAFDVDVPAVLAELDEIEDELGASPGDTEVLVVADVTATGEVDGLEAAHAAAFTLGLDPGASLYGVTTTDGTDEHVTTEPVTEPVAHGPLRLAAGPALVLGALVGAAGLVGARRRGVLPVTDAERARLAYRLSRAEFDEWITRGRLPEGASDQPVIEVEALEGLVNVAIDSDAHVIEDTASRRYVVLTDRYRYEYRPPPLADGPSA